MSPRQLLQSKPIISERRKIQGLIDKEHMPPLDSILDIVELDDSHNELRRYDGNTSGQRDPTNSVDTPTQITLEKLQHTVTS